METASVNARIRQMALTQELVDQCHRIVPDPGWFASKYDTFTNDDYTAAAEKLLAQKRPGPLWIFAYGSLMWKSAFEVAETRRAIAQGWQRGFSLAIKHYRATPDQPGFMMCLDRGGRCEGLALQMAEHNLAEEFGKLLVREIGGPEQLEAARWIEVEDSEGPKQALTFFAAPTLIEDYTANRPLQEIAHGLARACGHWGSGAAYLRNTILHLEELRIHEPELWKLQELVAHEIRLIKSAGAA
jgi:glutathione-specific gamma-glutamylcyclotransferase